MKVVVLGAGSFGTALAIHATKTGARVALWARRPDAAAEIREARCNLHYLPEVPLPPALEVTADLDVAADADVVLVAVPSHGFREVLAQFLGACPPGRPQTIVSATKGLEPESLCRMSEVTAEEARRHGCRARFAVISGPSFAAELADGTPTAAVVASDDEELAHDLQGSLSTASLRLYRSRDVVGVELGGACKNVVAIASGVVTGLGFGHNTLAALITRGLHEMSRLGLAYGGQPRTFSGLAGLGDLVLTCTGGLSRNRRAGLALAEGQSLPELEARTGMVAEGFRNSTTVVRLAERRDVEMPIAAKMASIIYQGESPRHALEELMRRELKAEAEL